MDLRIAVKPLVIALLVAAGCQPKVAAIEVTPTTVALTTQKPDRTLVAKALDADGQEVPEQKLVFTSDAPNVVDCSQGKLRGRASGAAKVTVTVEGVDGVQAIVPVTVELVRNVRLGAPVEVLRVGESRTLMASFVDDKGSVVQPKDAKLEWKSAQPGVATVTDGVLQGVAAGMTTVAARYLSMEATVSVTVNPPPSSADGAAQP
jgi:hypothetical protein